MSHPANKLPFSIACPPPVIVDLVETRMGTAFVPPPLGDYSSLPLLTAIDTADKQGESNRIAFLGPLKQATTIGQPTTQSIQSCFSRAPCNVNTHTHTLSRMKANTMDTREEGSLIPALASAFLTTCSNTKMPPVPISIWIEVG